MDDLISRQAAIDAFLTELTKRERTSLLHTWSTVEVKYFIAKILEQLPSAQPERKKGKWIFPYETTKMVSICSECGAHGRGNFCSICGADMRGEADED